MMTSGSNRRGRLLWVGMALLALLPASGCGPAGLLVVSVAGGAAAVSGEPQRLTNTQGQDFDEQRVNLIRSGAHTPEDIVSLLGHPQSKVFTPSGEEWAYRYHVPPSLLRSGMEKVLTIRFQGGKVQEVRYSISAL